MANSNVTFVIDVLAGPIGPVTNLRSLLVLGKQRFHFAGIVDVALDLESLTHSRLRIGKISGGMAFVKSGIIPDGTFHFGCPFSSQPR